MDKRRDEVRGVWAASSSAKVDEAVVDGQPVIGLPFGRCGLKGEVAPADGAMCLIGFED